MQKVLTCSFKENIDATASRRGHLTELSRIERKCFVFSILVYNASSYGRSFRSEELPFIGKGKANWQRLEVRTMATLDKTKKQVKETVDPAKEEKGDAGDLSVPTKTVPKPRRAR
jgi:hypothetical protein